MFEKSLEKVEGSDIIVGDLNTGHKRWGQQLRDNTINAYGRRLSN